MNIKIYSTSSCPYCQMLKNYLTEKGIDYVEKLVDQDELAKVEMSTVSGGFLGVPFTIITKNDGAEETIIGFDKGKLDSILSMSTNK